MTDRHPGWPEWLTPEYSALHTHIENSLRRGEQSVYNSADAAGMDWTTDGMLSCRASAVLADLCNIGWVPPAAAMERVEDLPDPRPHDWADCPTDVEIFDCDLASLEDYADGIAQGDNVQELAELLDDLDRMATKLRTTKELVAERLAEVMPHRLLELPGLPVMERTPGGKTVAWDSEPLFDRIVRDALARSSEMGIIAGHRTADALKAAIPVTPSLGWRVKALEAQGYDVDEWRTTGTGPRTVRIHRGTKP